MSKERFRRPKTNYTQVSNHVIDHESISPEAFFIYSKIQRYITLEEISDLEFEFTFNKAFMCRKSRMKEKTFDKYWKELLHIGLLKIFQSPDPEERGHWITEYELLHEPDVASPYFTQYNLKGEVARIFICPAPIEEKEEVEEKPVKSKKTVRERALEAQSQNSVVTDPPFLGPSVKPTLGKTGGHINNVSNKNLSSNINSSLAEATEREDNKLSENVSLIEKEIGLALSEPQQKKVSKWDTETLIKAIELFIAHGGSTFAYLSRCYTNPIITHTASKKGSTSLSAPKKDKFHAGCNHNWDFEELERLEQEYIDRQLEKSNTNAKL